MTFHAVRKKEFSEENCLKMPLQLKEFNSKLDSNIYEIIFNEDFFVDFPLYSFEGEE